MRKRSHDLYSTILDDRGLLAILQCLAGRVSKHRGIKVTVESRLCVPLSPLLELTVYRIVQEALKK